ncbi:MAG: DNA-processing protein DprA [Firmicutes bacterium]|nr:DNA-processing protein DprA [Bacillota bacterium]
MSEINDNKIYYWLSLAGVGARKLTVALSVFSPEKIYFEIGRDKALGEFFGKYTEVLVKSKSPDFLDEKLGELYKYDIKLLTLASEKYPHRLKEAEVCPPVVLYYRGDLPCLDKPCVAVVGTRAVSSYGKDAAKKFAFDFAASGVTVVSGLATGADSYAHEAAAEIGTTAAVLGGGHKFIPAYSQNLAEKLLEKGGIIISEYPPDFCPTKYTFPERNRIVSGLSMAVVVIEAGEKSGALITAGYALEQGREVYAVPGGIFSVKSVGSNRLLRSGQAGVALSAADIMSDLRINIGLKGQKNTAISLDFSEQNIYSLLVSGETGFDDLVLQSGFPPAELNGLLFSLELKGVVRRLPNNRYRLE